MKLSERPELISIPTENLCKSTMLQKTKTEVNYFLLALDKLKSLTIGSSHNSLMVAEFVTEFRRFKAMLNRLICELEGRDQASGYGMLCIDNLTETELFQKELMEFQKDYKEQKRSFQTFAGSLECLISK